MDNSQAEAIVRAIAELGNDQLDRLMERLDDREQRTLERLN